MRRTVPDLITGYCFASPDGREVWVAKFDKGFHVELTNQDEMIKFSMSNETADGLVRLITQYPEPIARVRLRK